MLVLTRSSRQSIRIGPDITVTVIRVQGGAVRLGIAAPRGIAIVRTEIDDHRDAGPAPASDARHPGGDTP